MNIAVLTLYPDLRDHAELLANDLKLPLVDVQTTHAYYLTLTPQGLSLTQPGSLSSPLLIDFLNGKNAYRRQHTSLRRESLARAMGLKGHSNPYIVDTTAGLGRDGFILASLGFHVTLLERSPIVHALLADALKRAELDPKVLPIVQRIHLIRTDAKTWLSAQGEDRPDIIYLDPMFPQRTKSALVKQDMRLFHELIGADLDANALLQTALSCAKFRVVIKRPRLGDFVAGLKPAFSHTGSSSRFDVYLK